MVKSTSKNTDSNFSLVIIILIVLIALYFWSKNDHFENTSIEDSEQILIDLKNNNHEIQKYIYDQTNNFNQVVNNIDNTSNNLDNIIKEINNDNLDNKIKEININNLDNKIKEININNLDNIIKEINNDNLDDKIKEMNNSNKLSCNLLGLDNHNMNEFKKKYYSKYSHQIECPRNKNLKMSELKKCNLDNDSTCNGIFTSDFNNNDTTALNYFSLNLNNKKDCVRCTLKNDEYIDSNRILQKKVTLNNIDNFTDFKNKINQNSIGETSVDKMAEIRGNNNSTCGLTSYGKTIHNVYDKLMTSPSYNNKNTCDSSKINGIYDNNISTDIYEKV